MACMVPITHAITAGAVIYAKDIQRLAAFYINVAGFKENSATSDFVVLETSAFQLVIVRMPDSIAETIQISAPPVRREDTPIKPIFPVSSIAAARAQAPAFGGALNPPQQEWQFQGHIICDGNDPEGNVIQLREMSA
jgi:predicted enzyme related to lactoylglutathione lyase